MHRPTLRAKQRVQDQHDRRHAPTPKAEAIRWLHAELAAGRAGLDPYDATILILEPQPHEQVWARAVILMCGLEMSEHKGCYRLVVEPDVRLILSLDQPDAPVMEGVPLASRGAESGPTAVMDAVFGSLPPAPEPRPVLTLLTDREVH